MSVHSVAVARAIAKAQHGAKDAFHRAAIAQTFRKLLKVAGSAFGIGTHQEMRLCMAVGGVAFSATPLT